MQQLTNWLCCRWPIPLLFLNLVCDENRGRQKRTTVKYKKERKRNEKNIGWPTAWVGNFEPSNYYTESPILQTSFELFLKVLRWRGLPVRPVHSSLYTILALLLFLLLACTTSLSACPSAIAPRLLHRRKSIEPGRDQVVSLTGRRSTTVPSFVTLCAFPFLSPPSPS